MAGVGPGSGSGDWAEAEDAMEKTRPNAPVTRKAPRKTRAWGRRGIFTLQKIPVLFKTSKEDLSATSPRSALDSSHPPRRMYHPMSDEFEKPAGANLVGEAFAVRY